MLLEASKSHADFHKYFKHIKNVNAFRKHDTIIFGKTWWTESTKKKLHTRPNKRYTQYFNPLSTKPIKWSNTLKLL